MPESIFVFDYLRYPVIPVKFYSKEKETPFIDALLDSGGDFIVIPMPIANYLGLKLKKAGSVDTAGGTASIFKAKLTMVLWSNIDIENISSVKNAILWLVTGIKFDIFNEC